MARTERGRLAVIPIAGQLLALWALPSCSVPQRISAVPAASSRHAVTEDAIASKECTILSGLDTLKHAQRSPNDGASYRNDEAVRELAALWPPAGPLAEASATALARKRSNGTYADADMGFEAVRASTQMGDGPLWCNTSVVLFRGEFASAEARCSWHLAGKQSDCIVRRYRTVFAQLGMVLGQEEAMVRIDYPIVLSRMNSARLGAVGEVLDYELSPGPSTPPELIDAERHLSDPLARLRVGSVPGRGSPSYSRQPPAGFTATKTLVDAKAIDALRRVLRGSNLEGRGFAAVGLSKLDALSQSDRHIVDMLKEASPISTQYGCMVTIGSAREFFSNLRSHHYMFERPGVSSLNGSN